MGDNLESSYKFTNSLSTETEKRGFVKEIVYKNGYACRQKKLSKQDNSLVGGGFPMWLTCKISLAAVRIFSQFVKRSSRHIPKQSIITFHFCA